LSSVQQNDSHSMEVPLFHMFPQSPASLFHQKHEMTFQRAELRPFALPGFHEVNRRATMVRAVIRRPPRVHEDYVIVSIDPLSNHPLHFPGGSRSDRGVSGATHVCGYPAYSTDALGVSTSSF
jgi:hypothetical protein